MNLTSRVLGVWLITSLPGHVGAAPRGPEFPQAPAWSGRSTLVMPDGVWHRYAAQNAPGGDSAKLVRFESDDEGRSWSEPYVLAEFEPGGFGGAAAVIDQRGEIQLFFTRARREGEGNLPAVDRFIDVWHTRSSEARTKWEQPRRIFEGYTGAISPALRMKDGRILLPIGMWIAGKPRGAPFGPHEVSVFYSDDDGATFTLSPARLIAPVDDDYNGDKVGACEPCAVELADGRVLMLMRTQAGFLYESISSDGINWPDAYPSRFHSSTGPPSLARLADDRIVLFWNNCQMPPKVGGQGVYGGRDALHAAIADPGLTHWRGFREVYRDPTRNLEPPKRGDRGTAYPESMVLPDGRVAVSSGQGGRRALFYVDPAWLLETKQSDDFSRGLEAWSVFTGFGPASGWWRNRTQGAVLVDHPDNAKAKALHLRRPDADKPPDGAVWNFPAGRAGTLSVRFMIPDGSAGGSVALVDRFFDPTDDAGEAEAMVRLPLSVGSKLGDVVIAPRKWMTLSLSWDADAATCRVSIDDRHAADVPFSHPTVNGFSYLRLRSTAGALDEAGWMVDRVEAWVPTP